MNATPVKTPGQGSLQIINIEGRYHKCEQFYNDLTTALIPQRHFSGTTLRQRSPLHRHRSALTLFRHNPREDKPDDDHGSDRKTTRSCHKHNRYCDSFSLPSLISLLNP